MLQLKNKSDFIHIHMTIDQADQSVYAIEQCHQALIRALTLPDIDPTTRTQAIDVSITYAGAIKQLRQALKDVGCPADPFVDIQLDKNNITIKSMSDQPMWRQLFLAFTQDKQLEADDGEIIATGKQYGNTFYQN
jgi:hypothetical protein